MAKESALGQTEKLLLAAFRLEESGKRRFSAEDLVVSVWQNFPNAFGLSGYRGKNGKLLYPDSEKVHKRIVSSAPIRKLGFLKKVGKRMYQLTEAGRDQARIIVSSGKTKSPVEKITLSRETASALRKLLASKVMAKFRTNQMEQITFSDACSFWGISPRSSAIELEGEIANFERIVKSAKEATKNKMVSFEHSGDVFGESDLEDLFQVHRGLLQKFHSELSVIQRRTDERV